MTSPPGGTGNVLELGRHLVSRRFGPEDDAGDAEAEHQERGNRPHGVERERGAESGRVDPAPARRGLLDEVPNGSDGHWLDPLMGSQMRTLVHP